VAIRASRTSSGPILPPVPAAEEAGLPVVAPSIDPRVAVAVVARQPAAAVAGVVRQR